MNRMEGAILSLAMIFVPLAGQTQDQAPELLSPLTASEEAVVRAKNDYYIRKHTYAASRHRLVKVNTDLLTTAGPISITLFDDVSLVADGKSVDIDNLTGSIIWHGQIAEPGISAEDLIEQLGSAEAADLAFRAITRVDIYAFLNEVDKASDANLEILIDSRELLAPSRIDRFSNAKNNPDQFYGVNATLIPRVSPGRYELTLLGMGGPYHILYEIDETKLIFPDNVDGPVRAEIDPATARKLREYEAFRISLGEDPRETIIIERLKREGLIQ